tara:strand:- start:32077 stop:32301 length:225 start_codon:yes stop_codon:yes gene_type:complete
MKLKISPQGNKFLVTDSFGRAMSEPYFTQEEAEKERQALLADSSKPVAKPTDEKAPAKPRKPRTSLPRKPSKES